jgi:hypothetical protein
MATDPAFAATVNVGSALPTTADTSLTAPTNQVTVLTPGASGAKVEEIVCIGVGTTVAGLIHIFRYDGSTYHLIDTFTVAAVTVSTTVAPWREARAYTNLVLKSADTLRAAQSIIGNASKVKVTAFGADF